MPVTRVYLPIGRDAVDALASGRPLRCPHPAHAVTEAVGRPGLVVDEEELEHLAWQAAVEHAAAFTADGVRRRVVAAADIDGGVVIPAAGPPSQVEVTAPVERSRVVSFHIDERPGATGSSDLLWFDVTEVDAVRALLDAP
ncbi:MAG: DUF6912 family protein [Dermatophilaceae bacterium]